MSTEPDDPLLYDAFDRFLEAGFRGQELDPLALASDGEDLAEQVSKAAELAAWVVSPPQAVLPSSVGGYSILRELGHGSMGTVYLARHEELRRDVALKVLAHSAALSQRGRRRFAQEARAMAGMADDHVVRVYDVLAEGGVLAYAMEWIDGPSLRDVLAALRSRGLHSGTAGIAELAESFGAGADTISDRSTAQFWLRIGVTIARTLQRAHDAGLVHRDVKPGNILLRRDGQPLLADFGLVLDRESSMSATGGFVGTPAYASPEQLSVDPGSSDSGSGDSVDERAAAGADLVDHRTDIYALGATLYECFSGAPPFAGAHPARVLRQIEILGAPPLRKVARGAPPDLEVVLEKAMSPDREDRYASATDFADDLERVLELRPIHARRVSMMMRGIRAFRYRHPSLLGGTLGAALVLVLAGVWLEVEARHQRSIAESAVDVNVARSLLMMPEVRSATWRALQIGLVDAAEFEAAQAKRRDAVRGYDRALARAVDPAVDIERDAVRLAIDLPSFPPGIPDRADLLREYPALASGLSRDLAVVVQQVRSTPQGPLVARIKLLLTTTDDLAWRLGLVAYLAGDDTVCEDCWQPLRERDSGRWPFTDVALASLYVGDGRFGLALPRVQRMVLEFPERPEFLLDLARVHLELGDIDSARRVLQSVDPALAGSFRGRLLAAWHDTAADPARAVETMRKLVVERPDIGLARYRLALLEYQQGNRATAVGVLRQLVEIAPNVARYRLTIARFAVASGDLELYLTQVRHVLERQFGNASSPGVTRDLLDVLQVGGLNGLLTRGVEHTRRVGSPDIVGLPDSAWARPPYGSRPELEDALLNGR